MSNGNAAALPEPKQILARILGAWRPTSTGRGRTGATGRQQLSPAALTPPGEDRRLRRLHAPRPGLAAPAASKSAPAWVREAQPPPPPLRTRGPPIRAVWAASRDRAPRHVTARPQVRLARACAPFRLTRPRRRPRSPGSSRGSGSGCGAVMASGGGGGGTGTGTGAGGTSGLGLGLGLSLSMGEAPGDAEEEAAAAEAVGRLATSLWLRLRGWEAVLAAAQRLLVWEKPLHSLVTAAALNGLFW